METISKRVLGFFTALLWGGTLIGGIALHLYTVWLFIQLYGSIGGYISFVCPVLSEFIMVLLSFYWSHMALNLYTEYIYLYLALIGVRLLFTYLFSARVEKMKG